MNIRKYLYISLVAMIFGLVHGYSITMIKNKNRINEAYQIVNSNHDFHMIEVDRMISEEGVDQAKKYVEEIIERNKKDYNDFLSENPKYIPLMEREDNDKK